MVPVDIFSHLYGLYISWLCVYVCLLGAGEGGETAEARIHPEGGGEQHQAAQRAP